MKRFAALTLGVAGAILLAAPTVAAEFEVKMLNKGSDKQAMVFEPAFVRVQPGDTVRFIPTDKGHDVETIAGMLPEGAKAFKSAMSQEITVTFEKAGVYGYKCNPHLGMGMVGVVQVGTDVANLDAARQVKLPPFALKRLAGLFDQAAKQATAQAGAIQ